MLVKIALAVIGIPLLTAGAMQGYLWYTTQESADRLIREMYSFAVIEYGGVHASLLGSVGLDNVRIRPVNSQDVVTMDAVRLYSSDLLSLYDLSSSLQQQRLPEAWSLSIDGLRASLYSDWLMAGAPPPPAQGNVPAGCRGDLRFAPETLEAIGYDAFEADIDIGYRFDSDRGLMELHLDYAIAKMFDLTMELRLAVTPGLTLTELQTSPPQLAGASLSLEQPQFYRRIRQYCAEQFDGDARRYIENQVTSLNRQFQATGLTLSTELINAYRRFLDQPEQASLILAPARPVAVAQLIFYSPTDLPELLGLQVRVNGVAVDDASIGIAPPPAAVADATTVPQAEPESTAQDQAPSTLQELITGADSANDTADLADPEPEQAVPPPRESFQQIPPAELSKHIGATVRIEIKNGRDYQGALIEVGAESLIIDARIHGGTAQFTVGFDRIEQASVLLRRP